MSIFCGPENLLLKKSTFVDDKADCLESMEQLVEVQAVLCHGLAKDSLVVQVHKAPGQPKKDSFHNL
jgi:hypothetical protein